MIPVKEIDGELWIKASDYGEAVIRAVEADREALAKDWESRHGYDKYGVAAEIRARGQS